MFFCFFFLATKRKSIECLLREAPGDGLSILCKVLKFHEALSFEIFHF